MKTCLYCGYSQEELDRVCTENDKLRAEVERLKNNTYCAYCGEEFGLSDFDKATKDVTSHIYTCEKHPMAKLRVGIQNTLDLARTGLKPDHYATEQEWLQHKVNVIAGELAQLLKAPPVTP